MRHQAQGRQAGRLATGEWYITVLSRRTYTPFPGIHSIRFLVSTCSYLRAGATYAADHSAIKSVLRGGLTPPRASQWPKRQYPRACLTQAILHNAERSRECLSSPSPTPLFFRRQPHSAAGQGPGPEYTGHNAQPHGCATVYPVGVQIGTRPCVGTRCPVMSEGERCRAHAYLREHW